MRGHSARVSPLTRAWHVVKPVVPQLAKSRLRRAGQFIHSRHLTKTDRLLLSYPKSGSTWLRTIVAFVQSNGEADAGELALWLPPLHMIKDDSKCSPKILRSHDPLNTLGFGRAGKVLILVRDPRALAVSFARHESRRGREITIEQSAERLTGSGFTDLGSWGDHARAIAAASLNAEIKWIRYEDLRSNTFKVVRLTLEHWGINCSDELLTRAIEHAQPENMRVSRQLAGVDGGTVSQSDVRSAPTDKWRDECPKSVQKYLLKAFEQEMLAFGYVA